MMKFQLLPNLALLVFATIAVISPSGATVVPDTTEALADEIRVLPGWPDALPSRMYAGFVDAGSEEEAGTMYTMHEHYVFVESEGDPATDPLIVWTNGGPGASSMFGLFVELGPFYLSGASLYTPYAEQTGIPSLFRNPYAWTKLASVLIINSPPPVGFSYCDPIGSTGDGNSCGTWNDTKTAHHNAIYLESWFRRFRKFQNHDWYIIGESYAGIYVPTLVRRILELGPSADGNDNKEKDDEPWSLKRNLKGFAVGDGCMGTHNICGRYGPGPLMNLEFMRGHGQMSDKIYVETFDKCSKDDLIGFHEGPGDDFGPNGGVSNQTCLDHLKTIAKAVGPFYAYGLYDDCWYQNDLEPPHNTLTQARTYFSSAPPMTNDTQKHKKRIRKRFQQQQQNMRGATNDYPCGGNQAFFDWVLTPQVKQALHVSSDASFFMGDNGIGFTYNTTEPDLMPFYHHVVTETNLRVLVYNGDTDPAINVFSAQNWTSHLGIPERQPWRPWTIDGKEYIGGYVTRYDNDFDFLTIRGAGHMVPQYKPIVSFEFLSKWLKNEDWLAWNQESWDGEDSVEDDDVSEISQVAE